MKDHKIQWLKGQTNFAQYFSAMKAGEVFKQPELARTLKLLAQNPDSFYEGEIADLIVAQMSRGEGIISRRDLSAYRAVWREPLTKKWRGFTVVTAPPPSSGGIALMQLLGMKDAAREHFREPWHNSAQYLHLLAEIEKRVFADRGEYLGDPDFAAVPVAKLTDKNYIISRAAQINPTAISAAGAVEAGLESADTTHFSVLDSAGNAVSLTYTLNWDFGSAVVVEGAGFLLNDEMDDFSAKVGVPNAFGVIGKDANAIAPGKRMLSSMTPTILLRDNKPALVVGTPGGSTIFTSVYQVILNIYDFSMPVDEAVAATRFHHQLPQQRDIRYDSDRVVPGEVRKGLSAMGYSLVPNYWGNIGDVHAILISADGVVEAASDPRGRGKAILVD